MSADECKHVRCCCLCEFHGAAEEPEECGECDCCTVDESDESQRAWAERHLAGNVHVEGNCPACTAARLILAP